ncbi:hypothetical protein [Sphaerisporangium fuscum]|uniref:hypothetical protein n=1 Tax=Sphaerisporangium fuscum TaxID=2835868 RepID=UPI001BDC6D64|nr:hypothetical protein [Sphaerisporangium fuscum]
MAGLAAVAVPAVAIGAVFASPGGGSAASGAEWAPPSVAAAPATTGAAQAMGDPAGDGGKVSTASKRVKKARDPADTASGPSKHTDTKAVTYFKQRWAKDKAVKRITDIRTVGKYLRIYTNLPENAHNSKSAIDLCKRGLEYLSKEVGEQSPVVFVQAQFGQNGNPVLANVIGPGDHSCRLSAPDPK